MLIVFFDYRGVVHHKFVPEGQTVNTEYYFAVLRCLRKVIGRNRPNNSWIFHHNSAPSHFSLIVIKFLAKQETFTRFGSLWNFSVAETQISAQETHHESIEPIKRNPLKELKVSVWKSGLIVGILVLIHTEPILKVIINICIKTR